MRVLISLLTMLRLWARSVALQLELMAVRHQLRVLKRSQGRRLRVACLDRLLWAWLHAPGLVGVTRWSSSNLKPSSPGTGFQLFWAWNSRHRMGRPTLGESSRH